MDIPLNLAGSIFLAGLAVGCVAGIVVMMLFSGGGERKVRTQETPHDVIMAIKRRAMGQGRPLTFFSAVGFFLAVIFLFVCIFMIMAMGKYITEGRPNGEEFIPFFLKTFIFPLQERFPSLFGM
jgi:hypothetical protein